MSSTIRVIVGLEDAGVVGVDVDAAGAADIRRYEVARGPSSDEGVLRENVRRAYEHRLAIAVEVRN